MARLEGRVALVTGAASAEGIGFAIARRLAEEGARVVLGDLAIERVEARAAELRAEGLQARATRHDVSSEEDWATAIAISLDWDRAIDIVINNAGIAILKPIAELTREDFTRTVDANLAGCFLGCKFAMDAMAGRGGAIVNISSVAGLVGVAGTTVYGATKGGIRVLTKAVAIEGASTGVRCNSIHPGAVWTEIQRAAVAEHPDLYAGVEADIPLGRVAEPREIANAALFLASDEASYITGAELAVDGGYTAG